MEMLFSKCAGKQMKWSKKGYKQAENMQKILPWQLVRMRSAVQIRPAAPESPAFSFGKAGFLLYFSTFPDALDFLIWI
mgnify:CR=1 FL=1